MLFRYLLFASIRQASAIALPNTAGDQQVLPGHFGPVQFRAPLSDAALIAYSFEVAIGTPSQSAKVVLDIESPTSWVQSTACKSVLCTSYNHTGVNFSASHSYVADPQSEPALFDYANVAFGGVQADESFTIADLPVTGQSFVDVTSARPSTFFHWYFNYNGVLGLASYSGVWQTIKKRRLLPRKLFTIIPPHGVRDMDKPRSNGELILGALPPHSSPSDYIRLPLLKGNTPSARPPQHPWATSLEGLALHFNNSSNSNHSTFGPGSRAYFSTTLPSIHLPGNWVTLILSHVGPTTPMGFFRAFPCEKRNELPAIDFAIGGRNITFSGHDYTFQFVSSSRGSCVCAIGLESTDEAVVSGDIRTVGGKNALIGLGWPFMEHFHMVFDEDEEIIMLRRFGES
ncbi:aspartic peptidase domain-containing protein [Lophiotrema nucula]|uniref:Aspartic peptidase domain-containing protein n=1 Tax=Lophiotrema nucula TaxID=690887 RepID=A0A6A5Z199_9PLEO|nr:aspartic peptidase domain-containing protein [Lophiotrema nucula]